MEIYPEEIDSLRFPGALERDFAALLQKKYKNTPIDLVVASGLEPLEFAGFTKLPDMLYRNLTGPRLTSSLLALERGADRVVGPAALALELFVAARRVR